MDQPVDKINKRLPGLFPNIPRSVLRNLMFDTEAIFSVTNQTIANDICKRLFSIKGVNSYSKVTDTTACVGGNVFSFVRSFRNINAIEIDPKKCKMLRHNLKVLDENYVNFDSSRVNIIEGNCLDYIFSDDTETETAPMVTQDILFIDPPWGGIKYKEHKDLDLYLEDSNGNNLELFDIIAKLKGNTKFIILKVPINYNLNNIQKVKDTYKMEFIQGYNKPNSMNIIVLSLRYIYL